ncbi:MAG: hypothetical protein EOP09_04840, partial [Proteobacteria bacterium]
GLNRAPALGISLIGVGLLYLPLRDWFWGKFIKSQPIKAHELLAESLHVAFAPSAFDRLNRLKTLLHRLFKPLQINQEVTGPTQVEIESDGLTLALPAMKDLPALKLTHPFEGSSLFTPQDRESVRQLFSFLNEAEASRESYDRGVKAERVRMAQDLHDDLGARLLSGLSLSDDKTRPSFEAAIDEMRALVSELAGNQLSFNHLLGEVRHESQRRLKNAQIELEWPLHSDAVEKLVLSHLKQKTIRSCFREIVSNIIRHSGATRASIKITLSDDIILITAIDNGTGFSLSDLSPDRIGYGLKSLEKRIQAVHGKISIDPLPGRCRFDIQIPSDVTS